MRAAGGARALAIATAFLSLLSFNTPAAEPETARQSAAVKVANRTIVVLRGPIGGHTAEERAKGTMERIARILASAPYPEITFADVEEVKATRVLLGGNHAFLVTQIDIDKETGETTQYAAREAGKRLEAAIRELREQQEPRYLLIATLLAAVATLIYGAILWLLYRGNRWIGGRLSAAAAAHSQKLHIGGVHLLDSAQVWQLTRRVFALVAWVIAIVLASGWLTFVLEQFPYTRPWGEGLEGNLLGLLKQILLAIVGAVPGLLLVVVIFMLARVVIRTADVFFRRVERGQVAVTWIDTDTVRPTRRIFNFIIYVFALAMAYPYLPGSDTEAFRGLSVLVGVMVSIGGASVLGQAFSGLILMYMKAFRRGDYVRIGDTEGTVVELGMFATRIRTGMGEEITLPNSGIMATTTKNYSRAVPGTGFVVDTVVTIGYSSPWRQVQAMLLEAARRTPEISKTPAPMVRQTALSDFYIEYRLIAYTPVEQPVARAEVLNHLHGHIQDVFNEHSVQIMSPHYMMDPKEPQVVPKDKWHLAPARPPEKQ